MSSQADQALSSERWSWQVSRNGFIKKSLFYRGGVKMATKKGSEVNKLADLVQEVNLGEVVNAEDPVKEVILVVMKILLWEEEWALVSKMNEYYNNLS